MFGKGDVEGVFLSKRDVGRLQTAGVAWAIEERGDHRVLSEASGTCVFLDPRTKGCGIYDVRPTQCRNFPFTPGKTRQSLLVHSGTVPVRLEDDSPEDKIHT